MDTKWRRFSRHRATKIGCFLLFIISIALCVESVLLVGFSSGMKYGLEPILCKEYVNSDVQMTKILDDMAGVRNKVYYQERETNQQYQGFLKENALEDSEENFRYFIEVYLHGNYFLEETEEVAFNYLATYLINGKEKTIGNITEEEFSTLANSGLTYSYTGGTLSSNRKGVPTPTLDTPEFEGAPEFISMKIVYPQDMLTENQKLWNAERTRQLGASWCLLTCGVIMLFSLIFLLAVTGKKVGEEKAQICFFDRLWTEVILLLGTGAVILDGTIIYAQYQEFSYMQYYYGDINASNSMLLMAILAGTGIAAVTAVVLLCLLSLARKLKVHIFWRSSVIGKFCRWVWRGCKYLKRSFSGLFNGERWKDYKFQRSLFVRQLVFVLGEILLWFITAMLMGEAMYGWGAGDVAFFFLFLCMFLALLLLAWYANGYARANEEVGMLCRQIDDMADGRLEGRLILDEKALLKDTAEHLNDIQGGIQKNIESQIKSERTKIELITNVSHDLKTPLTSIISYIDLLQKEELNDEARDYVNILAQKSDRLKNMVADVFDLAKTTSGEAKVVKEQLEVRKLLEQTMGDMEDKIEQSNRTFRVFLLDEPVYIEGDGQKLYRVFQNLIDNALKYSMEGTRIFIQMTRTPDEVTVSVKNTAAYEMEFTEEEILERFSRGDKSRTTEGNGLGLSIAKSFAEVCGGAFDIKIDGDQFKAMVTFPVVEKLPDPPESENEPPEESI
ncbi:sensor histidine kinase [Massiliimalia timonensis]|uniref:sensor histidine kinase n=1 Tax=Massiliimalia timonensis TaxID=1987501 RepID=UPI000B8B85B4|nr:HAMP domain-containing sensor histidine kinase [Massiliimalia timonensis]